MPITQQMLDQLLKDYKSPEDLTGHDGLLNQLTKALIERAPRGRADSSPRIREERQVLKEG